MTHFNILKQEGRKTLCLFLLVISSPLCHGGATKDCVMHYPSGFPAFVET